ncbi:MAG: hypothetical protein ACMXYG_07070 [Candidatus Woesearchaeota archaeon]
MKLNKKAATFEAYNWFLLLVAIMLLSASAFSLFHKLSSIPLSNLGGSSILVLELQQQKEIQLLHLQEMSKRVAYASAINFTRDFGNIEQDLNKLYYNAPIIMDSQFSNPLLRYSNELIVQNFFDLFYINFVNEFRNINVDFSYDKRSFSLVEGNRIYGFPINSTNISAYYQSQERGVESLPIGKAVIDYIPIISFKFQNYYIYDLLDVISFLQNDIYQGLANCDSRDCAVDFLQNVNKKLETRPVVRIARDNFEVYLGSQCRILYNDYFREYDSLLLPNVAQESIDIVNGKYYLCIFDKDRLLKGFDNQGNVIIRNPSYNVAVSTSSNINIIPFSFP